MNICEECMEKYGKNQIFIVSSKLFKCDVCNQRADCASMLPDVWKDYKRSGMQSERRAALKDRGTKFKVIYTHGDTDIIYGDTLSFKNGAVIVERKAKSDEEGGILIANYNKLVAILNIESIMSIKLEGT